MPPSLDLRVVRCNLTRFSTLEVECRRSRGAEVVVIEPGSILRKSASRGARRENDQDDGGGGGSEGGAGGVGDGG